MIRDLFGKVRFGARRWWHRLIEPTATTGGIQGCLQGQYPQAAAMACVYSVAALTGPMPSVLLTAKYPTSAINAVYPSAETLVSDWEC